MRPAEELRDLAVWATAGIVLAVVLRFVVI